jgi:hypothetical protein
MRRQQLPYRNAMLFSLKRDALRDELPQSLFISVLQLASTTFAKMRARRRYVVWAMLERTVSKQDIARHASCDVLTISSDANAARSDADDLRSLAH